MTRKEWEQLADLRETEAREAAENDDEVMAEYWQAKAQTARYNAAYGSEPESAQEGGREDD